jgi:prolyl 4-hydroxylase
MSDRPLDASWTAWLRQNLERGCDAQELIAILRGHGFALESIRAGMAEKYPAADPLVLSTGTRPLDDSWRAWLKDNLERRCDPGELLAILIRHQFSLDSIKDGMGPSFPAHVPDFRAVAEPPLLRKEARPNLHKVHTDKLQLYVLDGFMTHAHCDTVADLIDHHLRASTVTLAGTDRSFRTSRTCDLSLLRDPAVVALDEKIATTLGIRLAYSEGIQGQRYDVGQEFKGHTDFFEPGTDEYREHAAQRGNRTWTFMVYLNDGMAGGGTRFHAIDTTFQPRRGQALLWNNLYPDGTPNYDTLHSGMPVERGRKMIITKWFREKGPGPMFYGD